MKWRRKLKPTIREHDTRIVRLFPLFPYVIGEDVRWLEVVNIRQVVVARPHSILPPPCCTLSWRDVAFVDEAKA